MNRLLFLDTETGGIDPHKHSLLSIGYVLYDEQLGIMEKDDLYLLSEKYVVTQTAKNINHFDFAKHNERAIPAKNIINTFSRINEQYFDGKRIALAGHNIQFDIQFIKKMYARNHKSYEKTFQHRAVDTYSILKFLNDAGKIDMDNITSAKAFSYFGIKVNGRHTALGDATATLELYKQLIDLIKV